MIKMRMLSDYEVKLYDVDYQNKKIKLRIGTCGIFDSIAVKWSYYAISYLPGSSALTSPSALTSDISTSSGLSPVMAVNIPSIKAYFRKFENQYECDAFLEEFKLKWETGSNDTTQKVREDKLSEILE